MKVYGKTDIGQVRKANQDAFHCGTLDDGTLWAVVCDGMGGVNGGGVAAQIAVESISGNILSQYQQAMNGSAVKNLLLASVTKANIMIFDAAKENASLMGMGTTAIAVIIKDRILHIAHVGDSRVYLLNKETIKQLTTDHSMVQVLVERGQITEWEAKVHPDKNLITRALGVNETIETDYCAYELSAEDKVLLCTDGLSNYLEDEEMFSFINNTSEDPLQQLIDAANQKGGGDNITAVLIYE